MRKGWIQWRLYPFFLLIIILAMVADRVLENSKARILWTALVAILLAFIPTALLSRQIARPLKRLKEAAGRLASGDLTARVNLHDSIEFDELGRALNDMASQLDEKVRTITDQKNEQQAILASLREGVIALDNRERVLYVNDAARDLLDVEVSNPHGRFLAEVVRNSDLQKFISGLLDHQETDAGEQNNPVSREAEITVVRSEPLTLQATATTLRDSKQRAIGLLIVLNDITRLRRLEVIRRDFVANVSHELRTPITSIKGFVETLSEGALEETQHARSFLSRIAQNTDRLNAIIEDLLSLSRIEEESERQTIPLAPGNVWAVTEAAIGTCRPKAAAKQIEIKLSGEDNLQTLLNETLLEQAIINLLDNAIKYSENERRIDVEILAVGQEIVVQVRDQGCGIAAEHLPRLFERFYRVDRARSRQLGGTGLGLAIVKHIVQAHRGRVTVESTPGLGSTFSIFLPMQTGK